MRVFELCVAPDQAGLMVKQLLAPLHLSRRLRRAITESAGVMLNGRRAYFTTRVAAGDLLTVDAPQTERASAVVPEDIAISVAFEDEHVLVVDKAAGMVVHPTGTYKSGTLVAAVSHYLQARGEFGMCRPLHRLDRDTSGLIVFAKHKLAHERLVRALRARLVTREYTAYVHGLVRFDERLLDLPILRPAADKLQRAVAPYGKEAFTHVWTEQRFVGAKVTKVRLRLLTGRTHQIRVHMAHIGHPLLGDWLYGQAVDPLIARQALHAGYLRLTHPLDGRTVALHAALPADLQALEAHLEACKAP